MRAGHEQRPRPADETGSCEWRSAPIFARAFMPAAKTGQAQEELASEARLRGYSKREGCAKTAKLYLPWTRSTIYNRTIWNHQKGDRNEWKRLQQKPFWQG